MTSDAEIAARKNPSAPEWGSRYGLKNLWDEVVPGLWVGGTDDNDMLANPREHKVSIAYGTYITDNAEITPDEFDAVVTMYAWARPVDWGVEELRWGIMDSSDEIPQDELVETIEWAWRRWKAGKRVLCRCQAGLNRSSLIAAGVLIRDGWTAYDAVTAVRDGRTYRCLFNESFIYKLVELDEEIFNQERVVEYD